MIHKLLCSNAAERSSALEFHELILFALYLLSLEFLFITKVRLQYVFCLLHTSRISQRSAHVFSCHGGEAAGEIESHCHWHTFFFVTWPIVDCMSWLNRIWLDCIVVKSNFLVSSFQNSPDILYMKESDRNVCPSAVHTNETLCVCLH